MCYALVKESIFSGSIGVIRCDTMQQAGVYEGLISGSVDNRGTICRGASGPTGASVFAIGNNYASTGAPVIPLHVIEISPGAETYNSASWPATNPHIRQRLVSNLAAPMIDPTWTNFQPSNLGYDQADGNVLLAVSTFDHGVATTSYMIKVSTSTGAVLWATPWPPGTTYGSQFLEQQNVDWHNVLGLISNNQHSSLAPDTGALSLGLDTMGGVFLDSLPGSGGGSGSLSDASGSWFLAAISSYNSAAANAPIPGPGTPSSFGSSLAWIYFTPTTKTLTDAELLFEPLDLFYDFANESVRRLFYLAGRHPGVDGSAWRCRSARRRQSTFTTLGPPLDFTQNNGAGGGFGLTGSIGPADGPGCSEYAITEASTPVSRPEWRLFVSDDGSRTWSRLVKPRAIGVTGEYKTRLRWLKMGQFRQRVMRLECTDPVRRNIIGVYLDTTQGMS